MQNKETTLQEFTNCVFNKFREERFGIGGCSPCSDINILAETANLFKFIDQKFCSVKCCSDDSKPYEFLQDEQRIITWTVKELETKITVKPSIDITELLNAIKKNQTLQELFCTVVSPCLSTGNPIPACDKKVTVTRTDVDADVAIVYFEVQPETRGHVLVSVDGKEPVTIDSADGRILIGDLTLGAHIVKFQFECSEGVLGDPTYSIINIVTGTPGA